MGNVSRNTARYFDFDSTKLNVTNCLITEDPSLMFSIVKAARDQHVPGSLLSRLRGGKMRDPGNEVDIILANFERKYVCKFLQKISYDRKPILV